MYSIEQILNTQIGELGSHIKVGFKKTVKVGEFETEASTVDIELDLGNTTGPEKVMAYALLEAQAEYTVLQELLNRGHIRQEQFNSRIISIERYIETLSAKYMSITGQDPLSKFGLTFDMPQKSSMLVQDTHIAKNEQTQPVQQHNQPVQQQPVQQQPVTQQNTQAFQQRQPVTQQNTPNQQQATQPVQQQPAQNVQQNTQQQPVQQGFNRPVNVPQQNTGNFGNFNSSSNTANNQQVATQAQQMSTQQGFNGYTNPATQQGTQPFNGAYYRPAPNTQQNAQNNQPVQQNAQNVQNQQSTQQFPAGGSYPNQ